jgi:multiple sugar transport system ATP-binding protein
LDHLGGGVPGYAIEGLSVAYRGKPALSGVSFRIGEGELVVVLGGTGAGKTTLLRAMAGLQEPSAGRVVEMGPQGPADLSRLPPHRRDMAMVFQNFSLYPRMTVRENLAFPLQAKALGLGPAEVGERVAQAAGMLGLADKLDRSPGQLSGGELQRVALGRALVRRPKLFLLDEPLASLDAKLRERMALEIRRLQRALGCAMLYVTHDHAEAMGLGDRILALDRAIHLFTSDEAAALGLPLEGRKRVGIRPESWKVSADPAGPATAIVVEHMGPYLILVLEIQGMSLRATAPATLAAKAGDRFRLGIEPGSLLYFEK